MNISQKIILAYFRIKIKILQIFSKRRAAREAFRIFCTPLPMPPRKPKPSLQSAMELNFTWNGLHISGYTANPSGTKKLLLLHGFNSHSNNFHAYVGPAVEKGYQVFAFDAPAHGNSEGKQINAIDYANFIIQIARNYGPFDAFISHSFGGLAACLALEQIPHSGKTKLVLIAPATETTTTIQDAFKKLHISNKNVIREFNVLIPEISKHDITWFSIRRAVKNISANILWLHDEDDDITPVIDAKRVAADGHPNIRFHFTRHLGHRNIYRDENQIREVIHFL